MDPSDPAPLTATREQHSHLRRARSAGDVDHRARPSASSSASGGAGPSSAGVGGVFGHQFASATAASSAGADPEPAAAPPTWAPLPSPPSHALPDPALVRAHMRSGSRAAPPPVLPDFDFAPPMVPAAEPAQTPMTAGVAALSWASRVMAFFGRGRAGSTERRALVGMVFTLSLGVAQLVAVITLLSLAAHTESPTVPGTNEWGACTRPLGVWDALWLGRVALVCLLSVWSWRTRRSARGSDVDEATRDAEAGRGGAHRPLPNPAAPRRVRATPSAGAAQEIGAVATNNQRAARPALYARLSLLASLTGLAWFVVAHILVYTSLSTCRFSAPHLWWLTFGILCLTYLVIFEVFFIGMVVFVFGPLLFILFNIVLLCLGRHPIQNPYQMKPTIGKLPKSAVESIPLVLYIPPPPEDDANPSKDDGPLPFPTPIYTYPPKSPTSRVPARRKFRFAFLRRKKSAEGADAQVGEDEKDAPKTWEENWAPSELPFVRLEGNRAVCAICLMDFEEPLRAGGAPHVPGDAPARAAEVGAVQEVPVEEATQEQLRLADAGEGAQPLRLLACGHVFHKTCLDPWLLDISGRCPTCQAPVEVAQPPERRGRRRRQTVA